MRGPDKLLESIEGEPLLFRQAKAALATGLNVLVLIRQGDKERKNSLRTDPRLKVLTVADADEGMAATLRCAAAAAADQPMLILLPDVPGIRTVDIQAVLTEFARHRGLKVVRASDAERNPGTPICLPANVVAQFSKLKGDEGGRKLLENMDIKFVQFNNDRATRDLNTPDDWANWRAEKSGR
jgi:molybdenum cofactor cytidylyltransferase